MQLRVCALVFFAGLMMAVVAAGQPACVSDCGCPPGELCRQVDGVNRCEPGACPMVYDPVCGLDGKGYGNACQASLARVGVAHEGECDSRMCGGIAGIPCPEGQFCDPPPGQCDVADVSGSCQEVPEVCPEVEDPVCGCDGRTYGNDCKRQMAQVALDHAGECDQPWVGDGDREGCDCCLAAVISADGQIVWSHDPALVAAARVRPGHYRLTYSEDVSEDALFAQPLAGHTDVPRSFLPWLALDGPDTVEVQIDAHFVDGGSSHMHREHLDLRFSLLRCPGEAEE